MRETEREKQRKPGNAGQCEVLRYAEVRGKETWKGTTGHTGPRIAQEARETIQTTTFVWRIVTRRAILHYTRRGTERRQERDKTTSKWLFEARKGYKINRRVEDSRELVIVRGETGNSVKLESETKLSYFICATVRSFYMIFE